jgi:hypothetical protein
MNWVESLNKAIVYMEEHMTGEIDFTKVAQVVRMYHYGGTCVKFTFRRLI